MPIKISHQKMRLYEYLEDVEYQTLLSVCDIKSNEEKLRENTRDCHRGKLLAIDQEFLNFQNIRGAEISS